MKIPSYHQINLQLYFIAAAEVLLLFYSNMLILVLVRAQSQHPPPWPECLLHFSIVKILLKSTLLHLHKLFSLFVLNLSTSSQANVSRLPGACLSSSCQPCICGNTHFWRGASSALIIVHLVAVCVFLPDIFNYPLAIEILTHHEDCQGGQPSSQKLQPLKWCKTRVGQF